MNKSDKIGISLCVCLFFNHSELVSTLDHRQ